MGCICVYEAPMQEMCLHVNVTIILKHLKSSTKTIENTVFCRRFLLVSSLLSELRSVQLYQFYPHHQYQRMATQIRKKPKPTNEEGHVSLFPTPRCKAMANRYQAATF